MKRMFILVLVLSLSLLGLGLLHQSSSLAQAAQTTTNPWDAYN